MWGLRAAGGAAGGAAGALQVGAAPSELSSAEGSPVWRAHAAAAPQQFLLATASDARFKTDLKPLNNTLARLGGLRGYEYTWGEQAARAGRRPGEREIGLLAQEVEAAFPLLVRRGDYLTVDYLRLAAVLVEAAKELGQRLERLEAACGQRAAPDLFTGLE